MTSLIFVLILAFLLPQIRAASGLWGSSLHREGKIQELNPMRVATIELLSSCVHFCHETFSCSSLQHNAVTGECQLLNESLCDGDSATGYNLVSEQNWKYYDLDPDRENLELYSDLDMCTTDGKCSLNCARYLGESCMLDDQCLTLSRNSHCNNTGGNGYCTCDTHFWAYNDTLCLHTDNWRAMSWAWTVQRLVNNACELTFTANFNKYMEIALGNTEEYEASTTFIHFYIGWAENTESSFHADGQTWWNIKEHIGAVFNGSNQNFTIGFCDGKLRFGYEGQAPFLSHDTSSPPVIKNIMFRSHRTETKGYLFFPNSLVDPFFPERNETRTIRSNGKSWREFKITKDIQTLTTSVHFVFSMKGGGSVPHVLFSVFNNHNNQYQIRFDADGYALQLYTINTSWTHHVGGASLISDTEFRTFWVTIVDGKFKMGKAGTSSTLINYTPPANYIPSFNTISYSTHNHVYGYWKFHSHPHVHDHCDNCSL